MLGFAVKVHQLLEGWETIDFDQLLGEVSAESSLQASVDRYREVLFSDQVALASVESSSMFEVLNSIETEEDRFSRVLFQGGCPTLFITSGELLKRKLANALSAEVIAKLEDEATYIVEAWDSGI